MQIEKLTLKMQRASQNIADLQEQMEYYEGKRFTLDKVKMIMMLFDFTQDSKIIECSILYLIT